MAWIITKYLLTAGMVVFISEVAKRQDGRLHCGTTPDDFANTHLVVY
ncbi:hypothetical protein [Polynucleobacter necessarius]